MAEDIFFKSFLNMDAADLPPQLTSLVRPFQNDLNFSSIGDFGSIIGSVTETGQTFRNVFNNSISPIALTNMVSAGLQTELSSILQKGGFSKFLGSVGKTFSKTKYGYKESEKKLRGSPNIQIDFNPNGFFSSLVEKLSTSVQVSDDDQKASDDFKKALNAVRKKIFNLNALIYQNIEKIRVIHSELNLEETILTKVFHSEEIYSERWTDQEQIRNFIFCTEAYFVVSTDIMKKVANKVDYKACIALLKSQTADLSDCLRYKELKYVWEDLKLLRKTPDKEFEPIQ